MSAGSRLVRLVTDRFGNEYASGEPNLNLHQACDQLRYWRIAANFARHGAQPGSQVDVACILLDSDRITDKALKDTNAQSR